MAELEATKEAQMIVLETKEAVMRSLARQNSHLTMEVSIAQQRLGFFSSDLLLISSEIH